MKIEVWQIGKSEKLVKEFEILFQKKILPFCSFEIITFQESKKSNVALPEKWKVDEAERILKKIKPQDVLIVLDEQGTEYSSIHFSQFFRFILESGNSKIIFLSGGAFGFAPSIYQRAQYQISLSKMTFSHQLVRIIFLEQLYRAFTILRGIPYHHE